MRTNETLLLRATHLWARVALRSLIALSVVVLCGSHVAVNAITYEEGVHYFRLSTKQATPSTKDKVEVVEMFWYGCPHCMNYEPLLRVWEKENTDKVNLVVIPAIWNTLMRTHARLFYVAQALGMVDTMHDAIYDTLVVKRQSLENKRTASALFLRHGVSKPDFDKAWSSFLTEHAVKRAARQTQLYEITGTPTLIVDGEYRVGASKDLSYGQTFDVIDMLVERAMSLRGRARNTVEDASP